MEEALDLQANNHVSRTLLEIVAKNGDCYGILLVIPVFIILLAVYAALNALMG